MEARYSLLSADLAIVVCVRGLDQEFDLVVGQLVAQAPHDLTQLVGRDLRPNTQSVYISRHGFSVATTEATFAVVEKRGVANSGIRAE